MSEISSNPEFTPKIDNNFFEKGREFSSYGDDILGVAKERSLGNYSSPILDYSKLPQEAIDRVNTSAKTEEDVIAIKKASISLIIEAANQINNFEYESHGRFEEDLNSLLSLENALKYGGEFCLKTKKETPQLVLDISKDLMKSQGYKDIDDNQASKWLDNTLNDAQERVSRLRVVVADYSGY